MKVQVDTPGAVDEHEGVKGWHIDERGYLHVLKVEGGNLAAYAPRRWEAVYELVETDKDDDPDKLEKITLEVDGHSLAASRCVTAEDCAELSKSMRNQTRR